MLEGLTKEELFNKQFECQKKYEKLEMETIKKALTGEIGTNAKMIVELERLNDDYQSEMGLYDDSACLYDLNPITIQNFKDAEKRGENVIQCARLHLEFFDILDKEMRKKVYVNEDGKISDENGIPLSADGEHRVFEVIKGDGFGSVKRSSYCNSTILGVIKGGKQDK